MELANPLTYDAVAGDPALTPGWRGVYDYSTIDAVAGKVTGTAHNLAIQGLYRYIDPAGAEAAALEADGYVKTDWGAGLISEKAISDDLFLGGWKDGEAPRYFHLSCLCQRGGPDIRATPCLFADRLRAY